MIGLCWWKVGCFEGFFVSWDERRWWGCLLVGGWCVCLVKWRGVGWAVEALQQERGMVHGLAGLGGGICEIAAMGLSMSHHCMAFSMAICSCLRRCLKACLRDRLCS